jgi:hypothetical protein
LEPSTGNAPVGLDGGFGDADLAGRLRDREPTEESEYNDLALPGAPLGESIEGLVKGENIRVLGLECGKDVVTGHALPAADALGSVAPAGMVHQHFAHSAGCCAEEMAPVLGRRESISLHQSKNRLIN